MWRIKGLSTFAANFEVEKRASLDARAMVDTKADLLLLTTREAHDGNEYTYVGMPVVVANDGANNGIYILEGTDYTNMNNWKYIWASWAGLEIITAPTDIYVSNAGSDITGDGTELNPYETVKKVLDHPIYAGAFPYSVFMLSDYTFTQEDALSLKNFDGNIIRFYGGYTIQEDNLVWTMNDKFDFQADRDLGAGVYNNDFVARENVPWKAFAKPIKEANWFNVLYTGTSVSATYNKIISLDHTLTIDVGIMGEVNFPVYFYQFNIELTQNLRNSWLGLVFNSSKVNFNGFRMLTNDKKKLGMIGCRTENMPTYLFVWVNDMILNGCYLTSSVSTRYVYWCKGSFHWNIVEWWYEAFWSSRTNKCDISANYANWFIGMNQVITTAHYTRLEFFNYVAEWWNIKVTDMDYFAQLASYQDWDGLVNLTISINVWIEWTFNTALISHSTHQNFRYLDLERNVNMNLPWTYPEESGHVAHILPNNTVNGKISVWSVAENRNIEVKYNLERVVWITMEYRSWTISLLNNWTSIQMLENSQETGDLWIVFNNPTINGDVIEIDYTVDDNVTDITMGTRVMRQMIFS